MKDRIVQFLTKNGLSSTRFADEIGVQRSSISHILSGRNKPSFDFIEKMLKAYPDINAQWLMMGKGAMFITENTVKIADPDLFTSVNSSNKTSNLPENEKKTDLQEDDHKAIIQDNIKIDGKSQVERIVVFFNNGLFKEYLPSN